MATCTQCSASFEITASDLAFYQTIAPSFAGKIFPILPPTRCPPCRLQRRMCFRNERSFHKRKSDLSGKDIVSTVAPDRPYKIYDQDEWLSDRWDALEYGRSFDFNRTFAEQFHELNIAVPHPSLNTTNVENSTYTNYSLNVRNSYLVFGVTNAEDCLYGKFVSQVKGVVDCLSLYSCERCYEGVASQQCYQCMYFSYCQNCSDSAFIEDCVSCKNCLLCFGLRNKQYCVFNEQLDRAGYERKCAELLTGLTVEGVTKAWGALQKLSQTIPHCAAHIYASEDCTGDMISNSKSCKECFDIKNCEDCSYTAFTPNGVSSMDCCFTAPDGVQWCNEVISTLGQRCIATYMCWRCSDTYYSIDCRDCHNLFGCVGLQHQQYCIFNRQYSKQEYEELARKIAEHMQQAGEWGLFFPISLSQFAYNESIAHEYFPLTRNKAIASGWSWRDSEDHVPSAEGMDASALPRTIAETSDQILDATIRCEVTGRTYKIVKQEMQFYRSMGLPLPHKHPDERHRDRLRRKNPYRLWQRSCAKCKKSIETNYEPSRSGIVYCEECYLPTIY